MVGKHDEPIAARGVGRRLLEHRDDPIHPPQRVNGFDAVDARVVRDLVVIDEVDVDHGRASVHLLDDEGGGEVPQEHVGRGARERIRERARSAERATSCACRLHDLLGDLADREHDPPQVAVRTQEPPVEHVAAAKLACRIIDRRRGEVAAARVAREQVAHRRSAAGEQAGAVGNPFLDLARVRGMVGHQKPLGLLLPPAETGDAVVPTVKQARLARRGLRRQKRLPLVEGHSATDPARERRHTARQELAAQDRSGEAVDLDDDGTLPRAARSEGVAHRELAAQRSEERVVVADRKSGGEQRIDERVHQ